VVATTAPKAQPTALAKSAPSSPNNAFWLGAIAIALLIVVAAVVLADDAVPAPTATNTRLGRVLRERERLRQSTTHDVSVSADAASTLTPRRV
jgi:hypothetical protein